MYWSIEAHPRSRGENHPGWPPRHRRIRLIPAHAGKTRPCRWRARRLPAHPRSRGENGSNETMAFPLSGSSPLTRGKLAGIYDAHLAARLIPAHAGKTSGILVLGVSGTAHPRSRGENACSRLPRRAGRGSSPLTRGKPRRSRAELSYTGLIPAHAGKTHPPGAGGQGREAHPRSRGENVSLERPSGRSRGSSPLTRGKLDVFRRVHDVERLIPAHAGKTSAEASLFSVSRAHPRSRGENVWVVDQALSEGGSSPLTRGKHWEQLYGDYVVGLIPAHAGKTRQVPSLTMASKAHPRSRGENLEVGRLGPHIPGSSPLTRGKLAGALPGSA